MNQLSTDNIVALAIMAIGYLALIIGAYIKVNIKITEISKDIMAQKRELEEHKISNKESFTDLRELFKEYKDENRLDMESIKDNISTINKSISDLKFEILEKLSTQNTRVIKKTKK